MNDKVIFMNIWNTLPQQATLDKTIAALNKNGINAEVVASNEEAREKVLSLLPEKAEVMHMTSVTLTESGIVDDITNSQKVIDLKAKLTTMNRETEAAEMQKIGAAPEWAIGSVHAVTENGEVIIASNTGSQLPAYAYGAGHVIWVVGTQKIVANLDEGMKRIYEYTLPLESERAHNAYGVEGSNVSKLLIINKELNAGRINLIFINKDIGF